MVFDDYFVETMCVMQMDPKFLRNQRYARKHNKQGGESVVEE